MTDDKEMVLDEPQIYGEQVPPVGESATPEVPAEVADANRVPPPLTVVTAEIDLVKEIRGLRRWLIILTIVVVLMPVLGFGGCVMASWGLGSFLGEEMQVSEDQMASAKRDIERAWGPALESVDVRKVDVDYSGETPVPLLEGPPGGEKVGFIEYRVKGVSVPFTGALQFEATAADIGLLPQMGSLSSQMSNEEVVALAKAYAAKGGERIGGIASYFELMTAQESPSVDSTVVVGGEEYPLRGLWAVREGIELKDDAVDAEALWSGSARTYVFARDADGTFRYVGTESSSDWMMMTGF